MQWLTLVPERKFQTIFIVSTKIQQRIYSSFQTESGAVQRFIEFLFASFQMSKRTNIKWNFLSRRSKKSLLLSRARDLIKKNHKNRISEFIFYESNQSGIKNFNSLTLIVRTKKRTVSTSVVIRFGFFLWTQKSKFTQELSHRCRVRRCEELFVKGQWKSSGFFFPRDYLSINYFSPHLMWDGLKMIFKCTKIPFRNRIA